MVVGLCFILVFLFVPETFWDRTPRPHSKGKRHPLSSISKIFHHGEHEKKSAVELGVDDKLDTKELAIGDRGTIAHRRREKPAHHVGFAEDPALDPQNVQEKGDRDNDLENGTTQVNNKAGPHRLITGADAPATEGLQDHAAQVADRNESPWTPASPDYLSHKPASPGDGFETPTSLHQHQSIDSASEKSSIGLQRYTTYLRTQPPKTYKQTLKPWNGKLRHENWFLVAMRPFILFAYPSILWSALVYSLSIGWLIVLSESVTTIYRSKSTYNFTALQAGLIYISPFIGGILGTAVAGKFSDLIVRFMSRRNGGVYEPEFRLVMAIPVTIATCIGLMGFGWSAQERDNFIVPTVFFGVISFGCALGSTTSITFAVDSYRQYAGEALVTLNFSKSKHFGKSSLSWLALAKSSSV